MQVSRMKHGQGRTEKLWLLTVFRGPFSGDVTRLWAGLQLFSVFAPLRPYGVGGGGCETVSGLCGDSGVCVSQMGPPHICAEMMRVRVSRPQGGLVWASGVHHGNLESQRV